MASVKTLQPNRVVLALAGVALVLVLVLVLVQAPPAQGQNRGGSDVPSELWKTYPLDPSHGKARIRTEEQNGTGEENQTGEEIEPEQSSGQPPAATTEQPPAGTSTSRGTEVRDGENEPSSAGVDDSRTLQMLAVLVLSLVALLVALLVAPPAVRRMAAVPGSLARRGSASPLRSGAGAARPKAGARSLGSSTTTVRPAAAPAVGASRVVAAPRAGRVTRSSRRVRQVALPTASYATAPFRALGRVAAAVATGLANVAELVSSRRYHILLYSVAVLAAASLGFVVSLFLNGA
ncbi:MAG: hypothetical protein M3304_01380 [Actinomycetota bacterium]|nr:hypothetical protein [Actinomycetota bacterium]